MDSRVRNGCSLSTMTEHDDAMDLTPRGRATHARIVGAAADLIYCRGLGNTTLRDVREAATASGSQMTHYFSDKNELVRAVIAWRRDDVVGLRTKDLLAGLD